MALRLAVALGGLALVLLAGLAIYTETRSVETTRIEQPVSDALLQP